jgi:glycosyltransferase involved in cell wall biosynthesis
MRISVIIPCFNEACHVISVITGLKSIINTDFEYIVVDDCSTDGSQEVIRSVITPFEGKCLFHTSRLGYERAIETGLSVATGELILSYPGGRTQAQPWGRTRKIEACSLKSQAHITE